MEKVDEGGFNVCSRKKLKALLNSAAGHGLYLVYVLLSFLNRNDSDRGCN